MIKPDKKKEVLVKGYYDKEGDIIIPITKDGGFHVIPKTYHKDVDLVGRGEVMEQSILKLENNNKYISGTHITLIEENEIESIRHKILQIMPLASGKFLIERTNR